MVLSVSNVLFNMIAQHKTRIRMDPQRYVYMCCSLQRRRAASSIGSLIYQPQHLSLSGLCWSFYCWRTYYDLTYRHSSSIQSLFIHHLIPVKSFLSCFLCFLFFSQKHNQRDPHEFFVTFGMNISSAPALRTYVSTRRAD